MSAVLVYSFQTESPVARGAYFSFQKSKTDRSFPSQTRSSPRLREREVQTGKFVDIRVGKVGRSFDYGCTGRTFVTDEIVIVRMKSVVRERLAVGNARSMAASEISETIVKGIACLCYSVAKVLWKGSIDKSSPVRGVCSNDWYPLWRCPFKGDRIEAAGPIAELVYGCGVDITYTIEIGSTHCSSFQTTESSFRDANKLRLYVQFRS